MCVEVCCCCLVHTLSIHSIHIFLTFLFVSWLFATGNVFFFDVMISTILCSNLLFCLSITAWRCSSACLQKRKRLALQVQKNVRMGLTDQRQKGQETLLTTDKTRKKLLTNDKKSTEIYRQPTKFENFNLTDKVMKCQPTIDMPTPPFRPSQVKITPIPSVVQI